MSRDVRVFRRVGLSVNRSVGRFVCDIIGHRPRNSRRSDHRPCAGDQGPLFLLCALGGIDRKTHKSPSFESTNDICCV